MILSAFWLGFSVSFRGLTDGHAGRESVSIEWPEKDAPFGRSNIVERTENRLLVQVGSLKELRLEPISLSRTGHESVPRIVYQGVFRGQALALIEFGSLPESNRSVIRQANKTRFRLSWEADANGFSSKRFGAAGGEGLRKLTENSEVNVLGSIPAVKIPITEFGLYEIPLDNLEGLFPGEETVPQASDLALFFDGKPVPLELVSTESEAGAARNRLLFRGEGTFNDYTKTNVFWLTDTLSGPLLMGQEDATPDASLETPLYFSTTLHAEEDLHIWQTMVRGEGQDHWFWGDKLTAPGSRDYTLSVPFPAAKEREASMRVKYHGLTFSSLHRPDHKVQLSLNGQMLGDHFWDDRNVSLQLVEFPHGALSAGENTVTIAMPGLPGVVVDQVFINWIEIDYDRLFVASNDRLIFRANERGRQTFEVSGLADRAVDVFETSDIHRPVRLQNYEWVESADGGKVRFSASPQESSEFLVQSQSERREIPEATFNQPSFWKETSNGADYIVITHEDFTAAANRLTEYRAAQGLRTATVQIQDVYDEFAFGEFGPQAIRDFLSYAYHHWEAPKPQFVVMFGDAYLDYHDNLKTGSINYIPSQQINTELIGLTVSDNWFVQVDGDDKIPDLYLGRIPVRTSEEAERVVDRIIQYESSPQLGDWSSKIALIADDDDDEFVRLSEELAAYAPPQIDITRWYAADQNVPGRPSVVDIFESGHSLITYTGHGTISSWGLSGNGSILLSSAVAEGINPNGRWPIVTVANCLNGFFAARQTSACLAEALLSSQRGGAIAVWAPTSLGFPAGHRILMNEFYRQVFENRETTLGAATTAAQIATFVHDPIWLELLETYVLFGDPALKIHLDLPGRGPALTVERLDSQELVIEYEVEPGLDYTVYAAESLGDDGGWLALEGAPHNEGRVTVSVNPELPARFYKVESVVNPISPLADGGADGPSENAANR